MPLLDPQYLDWPRRIMIGFSRCVCAYRRRLVVLIGLGSLPDELLDDSKFCVLPLTSDTPINPFRCKPQTWQGSRLLFHAIVALCYRHLNLMTAEWSEEVDQHRRKAGQLLALELRNLSSQNCLHLLEPILILFTLDVCFGLISSVY
jgi:hypothetical protein